MGKAILIIVLIVAAFFIYRHYNTPPSPEEQKVIALDKVYSAAVAKFAGSTNSTGIAMDLSTPAEGALAQIQKLRRDLADLKGTLAEPKALRRAEELQARIEEFCRKNDIK